MLRKSSRFRSIDILFALLLFSVFAMAVLMVLLSGGRIYKNVVGDMAKQYEERTSVYYIATKLRACDTEGSVKIAPYWYGDALFLSEPPKSDGKIYETIIYLYDGMIKEQYAEQGKYFPPNTGMTILNASSLNFSTEDNDLIVIEYEAEDCVYKTFVHLRVKGAVAA